LARRSGGDDAHRRELAAALSNTNVDIVAIERERIKGAVRTDFILSAEIIVISLGIVASAPFATRVTTLIGVALLMTVGVYGLVAAIVKLDDAGLYLSRRPGGGLLARALRAFGSAILRIAPWFMKALSIVGTLAMLLVGGGILVHGIPLLQQAIEDWSARAADIPVIGQVFGAVTSLLLDTATGALAGAAVYAVIALIGRLRATKPSQAR
jgi:predicted DNA repair protein MutK